MDEMKTRSFRVADDTLGKIKEISSEIGGNQQEVFAKLIECYEFQKGKSILLNKRDDIEKFEQYLSILTRIYMGVLEENENITNTVRTEFISQLDSKDEVIYTLQKDINKLKEDKSIAEAALKQVIEEKGNMENRFIAEQRKVEDQKSSYGSMIKDKDELNRALATTINNLEGKISDMEGSLSKANDILCDYDNQKKVLEDARNKITLLENELEGIKQKTQLELESTRQKAQFEIDQKMLQYEKEYQQELQKIKSEHQAEIDKYQKKYFELLEKIPMNYKEINQPEESKEPKS